MRKAAFPCITCLSLLLLCSCVANFETPCETRRALCRELNSEIIFNGATSYTRNAEIQKSYTPIDQRDYELLNCEQFVENKLRDPRMLLAGTSFIWGQRLKKEVPAKSMRG